MEVTVRNSIARCPEQCTHADVRVWKELRYGTNRASVIGIDVHVSCAHMIVCKLAERGQ